MAFQSLLKCRAKLFFFLGTLLRVGLLLGLLLASGCRSGLQSGSFEGFLTRTVDGKVKREPIQTQVHSIDRYSVTASIQGINHEEIERVSLRWSKSQDRLRISIPALGSHSICLSPSLNPFEKNLDWKCYQKSKSESSIFEIVACFSSEHFMVHVTTQAEIEAEGHEDHRKTEAQGLLLNQGDIELRSRGPELVFSLRVNRAHDSSVFRFLEEPRVFTLTEAIRWVKTKNFDSRIEYQKWIETREAARAAAFNLIPHVNIRTIAAVSTLNPRAIGLFASDFVPFVIPTRWLKVKEARELNHAERLTLDILRADLVNQLEVLAYSYQRDQKDLKCYQKVLNDLRAMFEKWVVIDQEKDPQFEESSFRIQSLMNQVEQEINRLESSVLTGKTSIAHFLGFMNPQAIQVFQVDRESTDEANSSELIQTRWFSERALLRSLEVRQLHHLIQNAELQKKELYFNWMDPDVPSSQGISLSLIPYSAKAASVKKQIQIQQERAMSKVLQRADSAVIAYNFSLEALQIAKRGAELSRKRVEDLRAQWDQIFITKEHPALSSSLLNSLQSSFQTYFLHQTRLNAVEAAFLMAKSQVERLLLSHIYADFDRAS